MGRSRAEGSGVRLREARPGEYERIGALYVRAYSEFAPAMGSGWDAMRANLSNVAARAGWAEIVVAETLDGGELAGAVMYTPPNVRPATTAGTLVGAVPVEWAYVGILGVSPEHRGLGAGRALTAACVERAHRDRAATLGLVTREVMVAARRLYESMGFVRAPELDRRAGPGVLVYRLDHL
jgi:ribosomal protein S18 acetylase RimI-like enzyme